MGGLKSPGIVAHRYGFLQGTGCEWREGTADPEHEALGVPAHYLGGTAGGSEALRWRAWPLRMSFDNVAGGCPNEGKVYRSLGLEWEGGSFCGSPGGIGVEKRGLEIWVRCSESLVWELCRRAGGKGKARWKMRKKGRVGVCGCPVLLSKPWKRNGRGVSGREVWMYLCAVGPPSPETLLECVP